MAHIYTQLKYFTCIQRIGKTCLYAKLNKSKCLNILILCFADRLWHMCSQTMSKRNGK